MTGQRQLLEPDNENPFMILLREQRAERNGKNYCLWGIEATAKTDTDAIIIYKALQNAAPKRVYAILNTVTKELFPSGITKYEP